MHNDPAHKILYSKRAHIYYLEHCRILLNGGRVEYVTEQDKQSLYWNIPIANTTCLLLGNGTSITQAAARELAKEGVMVGFCGGDGTPLFSANEVQWLSPQSEYRPTAYLQQWCGFWFDDDRRLQAAKRLQQLRLDNLLACWPKHAWDADTAALQHLAGQYRTEFAHVPDTASLLAAEGRMTAALYALANRTTGYRHEFKRGERGSLKDPANRFLDHGNYLAYGLGATACWVLGLPHGLAVLHGKTRRGGLVFDAADLIKDALVLPQAFINAMNGDNERDFRQNCIRLFMRHGALDNIINCLKHIAATV